MALFLDTGRAGPGVELKAPNCVTIGLVNNMPDAAVEATERQFTDLIRAATPNVVVLLKLYAIPEVPRAPAMRRELTERYRDIAELWDTPLDGLIVTGTEPRAENLRDEPYWETMSTLVDWASGHTSSAIWSCLAAHAAVLHADGIERRPLKEKRFGVFDCRLAADHPMTQHFPEPLWVPHSRYNDLPERALSRAATRYSPVPTRPGSMPSPSRTAASRSISRAIRNTTPIRCFANIAAMPPASSAASAPSIRLCRSAILTTRRRPLRRALPRAPAPIGGQR